MEVEGVERLLFSKLRDFVVRAVWGIEKYREFPVYPLTPTRIIYPGGVILRIFQGTVRTCWWLARVRMGDGSKGKGRGGGTSPWFGQLAVASWTEWTRFCVRRVELGPRREVQREVSVSGPGL